ncbi:DNA replication complex GINS protein PSF1 isoform X2 [Folsomia candida]|uniref:DNA replication complex GINS protein PSF1 isoform X2 n=1 Tax=Folsomia candida TaxID=158441 RepID=UPI000B9054CD|nr:DNA replication complex GINS protein PSF1 isoform X2 [Folsomia candida]
MMYAAWENGVRQVLDEMQLLFDQNQKDYNRIGQKVNQNDVTENLDVTMNSSTSTGAQGEAAGVYLRHTALERNKDCLLAYMSTRLERIRDLRWIKGSVLPEADQNNMTEQELQYFTDYNKILANYMRDIGVDGDFDGLDLTEHMEPPKSHMVYFKVLKEYGEFEPEDGKIIVLRKNCVHHLPKYQCETLIRQGVIEILTE